MSTIMKTLLENLRYSIQSIVTHLEFENTNSASSWGYGAENGPDTWANVWPIATEGQRQSPVVLSWAALEDPSLNKPRLMVQGGEELFDIENTGETWKATIQEGSEHILLRNGPLPANQSYTLAQFHAHWGGNAIRGSEHLVDGKPFAAELHMVFWNCSKYTSFGQASKKPDGLAVLAVFLEEGDTTRNELHKVCNVLKNLEYKGSKHPCPQPINPTRFLPWHSTSGGRGDMSYWTYEGSLTTPPLFESVTWIVFKKPMTISTEQLETMRNMKCNVCSGKGPTDSHLKDLPMIDNFRPPQPINDRVVRQVKL